MANKDFYDAILEALKQKESNSSETEELEEQSSSEVDPLSIKGITDSFFQSTLTSSEERAMQYLKGLGLDWLTSDNPFYNALTNPQGDTRFLGLFDNILSPQWKREINSVYDKAYQWYLQNYTKAQNSLSSQRKEAENAGVNFDAMVAAGKVGIEPTSSPTISPNQPVESDLNLAVQGFQSAMAYVNQVSGFLTSLVGTTKQIYDNISDFKDDYFTGMYNYISEHADHIQRYLNSPNIKEGEEFILPDIEDYFTTGKQSKKAKNAIMRYILNTEGQTRISEGMNGLYSALGIRADMASQLGIKDVGTTFGVVLSDPEATNLLLARTAEFRALADNYSMNYNLMVNKARAEYSLNKSGQMVDENGNPVAENNLAALSVKNELVSEETETDYMKQSKEYVTSSKEALNNLISSIKDMFSKDGKMTKFDKTLSSLLISLMVGNISLPEMSFNKDSGQYVLTTEKYDEYGALSSVTRQTRGKLN